MVDKAARARLAISGENREMKCASCCFSDGSAEGLLLGNFCLEFDGKVYRSCDEAEAVRFLMQGERARGISAASDRYLRPKLRLDELPGVVAYLHRARCIVQVIEDRDAVDRAEM